MTPPTGTEIVLSPAPPVFLPAIFAPTPKASKRELNRTGVGAVYRASNQHELGRIEILDRFWPYQKESGDSTADQEQAQYNAGARLVSRPMRA